MNQPTLPMHRFEEFEPMSEQDLAALALLGEPQKFFRRQSLIRTEGIEPQGFFLLVDGWAAASQTVASGGRQILKVHLPGDALGTPSMCLAKTCEELRALTDVVVTHVPLSRFGTLIADRPRLAARFMLSIQSERVALMDRLASIGRTNALSKVAAVLGDLKRRLEPLGLVDAGAFDLVITQEQLADIIGLTNVHVNRKLHELERAGLIARNGQRITIVDETALARLAGLPIRRLSKRLDWLPS